MQHIGEQDDRNTIVRTSDYLYKYTVSFECSFWTNGICFEICFERIKRNEYMICKCVCIFVDKNVGRKKVKRQLFRIKSTGEAMVGTVLLLLLLFEDTHISNNNSK